mmetsp:Transcript_16434/g.29675  ORF Transcript_16434/g.29675 Transcript_16434/m.29675 type:complete len:355 (-) Transcript_16434:250-1314(-)|eukprot:CAMPEP_0175063148 /NCGR_PEP_ID=MMETSP0052_2-20121109/14584_1 /TAXON_ID=51329 ORGANISM="Polytomella parva, Strain SAG 63-3" /NCGR_SAMPLE_ID=MMETSP0052_2 /ASSEMBLY_ACC=CAM_ASM_000194 /LENGTH=354 /DNA_ID=CAMNT_0016329291 /DNA_START=147 /DNA_END=1211 /DNA_ORIENTATION=-
MSTEAVNTTIPEGHFDIKAEIKEPAQSLSSPGRSSTEKKDVVDIPIAPAEAQEETNEPAVEKNNIQNLEVIEVINEKEEETKLDETKEEEKQEEEKGEETTMEKEEAGEEEETELKQEEEKDKKEDQGGDKEEEKGEKERTSEEQEKGEREGEKEQGEDEEKAGGKEGEEETKEGKKEEVKEEAKEENIKEEPKKEKSAPALVDDNPTTPPRNTVAVNGSASPRSSAVKVSDLARQLQSAKEPTSPAAPVASTASRSLFGKPALIPSSAHSSTNTINASLLIQSSSFKFVPLKDIVSYKELCSIRLEDKLVDPTRREDYLSESEFEEVFGMKREAYEKLPAWRKQQAKKKVGLF